MVVPDCRFLHDDFDITTSGVYTIYPSKYPGGVEVYCDMDTQYGGWIVFQKRFDGSVNFTRYWSEYQDGFGEMTGEFWLGNEILLHLTAENRWSLRVDLKDDQGEYHTLQAMDFGISGNKYTLTHGGSFQFDPVPPYLNMRNFSTYDMDNDEDTNVNCAAELNGGWWLGTCNGNSDASNGLNGEYQQGPDDQGIMWVGWEGHRIVKCEMKLRRF
ncbi:ficolin-1-like isoform X2 [Acanthaster planci]|uniref:Ficolin-1-like isoform X2 n=1 Tax=Acanthaster planci TaxID=133434 RepID=A0A8B7ZRZ8_ACAPL|nr:ficolin-1-like isoform X2 [Acanthaster planci]